MVHLELYYRHQFNWSCFNASTPAGLGLFLTAMDWNLGRQLESPPLSQCDEKSPNQKLIFNNFHLFRLVGEGFNASVGRSSVEVRRFERFDVGRFLRRQNVESQRRKNAERRRHGNVKIRCRRETFFSGSSSEDFKI